MQLFAAGALGLSRKKARALASPLRINTLQHTATLCNTLQLFASGAIICRRRARPFAQESEPWRRSRPCLPF